MTATRGQSGFTVVELLIGMSLALIVVGATLMTFNALYSSVRDSDARFDQAEVARNALDRQARQLRNLAKRLNNTPVIDTAGDYDLIFQTSDPARTWVRYCLDTTTAPASLSRGRLWEARLALPPAGASFDVTPAMRSGCPGAGWTTAAVVADHVTNTISGHNRPLFSYLCSGGDRSCAASAAGFDEIVQISGETIVDMTPGSGPREVKLASGVHLRNQNQPPTVSFIATPTMSRTVQLNASGSTDYEGRTLSLFWFSGAMPTAIACDRATATVDASGRRTLWGGLLIGEGMTLSYAFPSDVVSSAQNIGLVGCDPGDRYGTAGLSPSAAIAVPIPN